MVGDGKMIYVELFLIFVMVSVVSYYLLSSTESTIEYKRSVKQLSKYEIGVMGRELTSPFYQRVVSPYLEAMLRLLTLGSPKGIRQFYDRKLMIAGQPGGVDGAKFVAIKTLSTLIFGAAGFLMSFVFELYLRNFLVFTGVFAASGYLLPDIWLSYAVEKRKINIKRELPDVMDLMVICIEAGLSFDSALGKIIKHSKGPISKEFARTLYEIQIGMERKEAFKNLYERTDVEELRRLSNAITQSDIFGVSVSNVLRTHAEEMRTMRKQAAEEKAQKIGVKITFPLILCIFPAMFVVILGPAAIRLMEVFS